MPRVDPAAAGPAFPKPVQLGSVAPGAEDGRVAPGVVACLAIGVPGRPGGQRCGHVDSAGTPAGGMADAPAELYNF
ncbi:hypothetical protein AB0L13_40565 [Saccharopolyspora shandongensis]|uniref:hypothetical protein n=1 Tax=Saccharopolyspora shandongensis TaxID=418495 RepID=UPI003423C676